ncbi:MAG: type II toxin-antitoxin system YafQ family toxin [Clostridiales bacterium]|jgi:mRNA interferase YafQ|nr:type II toxin-antitoxin system YafQ family toxin [Clostridiales bacterium]
MRSKLKYEIWPQKAYRKQYKLLESCGYDMSLLDIVAYKLACGEKLPPENRDHPLKGKYKRFRDCHIKDDWF